MLSSASPRKVVHGRQAAQLLQQRYGVSTNGVHDTQLAHSLLSVIAAAKGEAGADSAFVGPAAAAAVLSQAGSRPRLQKATVGEVLRMHGIDETVAASASKVVGTAPAASVHAAVTLRHLLRVADAQTSRLQSLDLISWLSAPGGARAAHNAGAVAGASKPDGTNASAHAALALHSVLATMPGGSTATINLQRLSPPLDFAVALDASYRPSFRSLGFGFAVGTLPSHAANFTGEGSADRIEAAAGIAVQPPPGSAPLPADGCIDADASTATDCATAGAAPADAGDAADPDVAALLEVLPAALAAELAPYAARNATPALLEVCIDAGRPVVVKLGSDHGNSSILAQTMVGIADAVAAIAASRSLASAAPAPAAVNAAAMPDAVLSAAMAEEEGNAAVAPPVLPFRSDNRLALPGSLHRISAMRDVAGGVVGLTYRVGRHVAGAADILLDVLADCLEYQAPEDNDAAIAAAAPPSGVSGHVTNAEPPETPPFDWLDEASVSWPADDWAADTGGDPDLDLGGAVMRRSGPHSLLLLGPPGVGKTTLLRDISRVCSDVMGRSVIVIDTSNEIGGDAAVPHPCIGQRARR